MQTVCKRSDISEDRIVFDERERNLVFLVFFAVSVVIVSRRHRFLGSCRDDAAHELADFVCVNAQRRDVEVAQIHEQAAVFTLVVTLFVLVAIA